MVSVAKIQNNPETTKLFRKLFKVTKTNSRGQPGVGSEVTDLFPKARSRGQVIDLSPKIRIKRHGSQRGFRVSFFCHLDFARHDILVSLAWDGRAAASVVGRAVGGVTAGGVLVTLGVAFGIFHGARVVRGHMLHDLTV